MFRVCIQNLRFVIRAICPHLFQRTPNPRRLWQTGHARTFAACGLVVAISAGAAFFSQADEPATARTFGIEQRVPWTAGRITGSPEPPPPYRAERAFPQLELKLPVDVSSAPGSDRLFLMDLRGEILSFPAAGDFEKPDLFADLKEIEGFRRAYGMAFHPRFEQNRYVFLCYVLDEGNPKGSRVSRFEVSRSHPPVCDLKSEKIVLEWYCGGHNGGCLKFGPNDGCLYISTGDGATPSPPDAHNAGQNIADVRATIMRIDVDREENGLPYAIPRDNPFVSIPGARPEVFAFGFRNPWKMSFDPKTGGLWVGDVGWEMWEMIYHVTPGGNYGWSIVEGPQSVRPEVTPGPTPIIPPVISHSHIESRSITGGLVYQGDRLPELKGAYIYGDYVTGKIWGLKFDGEKITWQQELATSTVRVVGLGEDHRHELYILGHEGSINRLVPSAAAAANAQFPKKLSETGIFASVPQQTPAPGVIPYAINAEPWMDGGVAERFVGVPGDPKLNVYEKSDVQIGEVKGAWIYPSDTVFAKTISLPSDPRDPAKLRRIETQILHRDGDTWKAYAYLWNDEQTDAELAAAEGLDLTLEIADPAQPGGKRQQTWHIASRTECIVCHTTRAGSIHGFNVPQLNRDFDYGKSVDNQLRTLTHIGLFEDPLQDPQYTVSKYPELQDDGASLESRARAYLHVNCAHCHRRGGGGTARFELQYELSLEKTLLLGDRPSQGTFGIHAAEVVAPGDPYRSVLYYRMATLGKGHMPHAGSSVIDAQGLSLMHDWIASLERPASKPIPGKPDETRESVATARIRSEQFALVEKLRQNAVATDIAADGLLSSPSGALVLLAAIDRQPFAPEIQTALLEKATAHPSPEIRGLFERFVPEEKRVKRLGSVVQPNDILSLRGDAARGFDIFFKTEGVQCRNCHMIQQQGKELGPALTSIGKKLDRAKLLENILEPSREIDAKYIPYIVETTAGRVHAGLLVSRDDKEIVLKDTQHQVIRVPAEDIEFVAPQRKSIMPELQLRDMTAQQVADLLEYLASLK